MNTLLTKNEDLPNWKLTDAIAVSEKRPDTFHTPCIHVIEIICLGDQVELGFEVYPTKPNVGSQICERLRVKVTSITTDCFEGTLENAPAFIDGLEVGETIRFQAHNVMSLDVRAKHKLWVMDVHGLLDDHSGCQH
jgi:hypothetical protein